MCGQRIGFADDKKCNATFECFDDKIFAALKARKPYLSALSR